ncbi:MAG TPA: F0F1 ATP synthase subunit A [Chloroflexia bacterium]|nr:F0F1 ATP synthase subunit A [Chloroflexia bacterium]
MVKILRSPEFIVLIVAIVLSVIVENVFRVTPTSPHPSFTAEKLVTWGFFSITNSMIMALIVAALLVLLFARATGAMSTNTPGRLQSFAETVIESLLGLVESTAGKRTGRVIFPLIATLFIFIISANWLSLLPISWFGVLRSEAGGPEVLVPFLRAPNADLNMTLAMALIAFIVIQSAGVIAHGPGGYAKELTTPIFLAPVHIIGEISRIISLSFRLFGNIFGGEVLLGVMYFLLSSIFVGAATLIFVGMELLFGTIQALVFSLLTLVYISMAVAGHGDSHGHDDEHNPAGEGIPEHPQSGTEVAMG